MWHFVLQNLAYFKLDYSTHVAAAVSVISILRDYCYYMLKDMLVIDNVTQILGCELLAATGR